MAISRNQENFAIMTVIYDELVDFYNAQKQKELGIRNFKELAASILEIDEETVPQYVINCIFYSLNKYGEIVNAYIPFLKKWSWERLPLLTQSILLMSYSHFFYVEKIDKRIVISVAVKLAKKYVDLTQAKFINAILDGVLNRA